MKKNEAYRGDLPENPLLKRFVRSLRKMSDEMLEAAHEEEIADLESHIDNNDTPLVDATLERIHFLKREKAAREVLRRATPQRVF